MKTRRSAIVLPEVTMAANCPIEASCEARFTNKNQYYVHVRCDYLDQTVKPKHGEPFVVCLYNDC